MTRRVVTLGHDSTIGDALAAVAEHQVRHLPIVEEGAVVGMLSDRDLRRVEGLVALDVGHPERSEARLAAPVATLLEGEAVTVSPSTPIDHVIDRMLDEHVGAVAVVRDDGRLVGLVSYVDILRAARGRLR